MGDTKIEWTDKTWNPIRGCSRVSEGCRNCYAERQAARFRGEGEAYGGLVRMGADGPHWTGEVAFIERNLEDPLHWRKPCRVFVNSMSDLFHEKVQDEWLNVLFSNVMEIATRHTFQILTKRPERMLKYLSWRWGDGRIPMRNIWIGVSVEDQKTADERIPLLLETPAAVRFISYEPALGPIDLDSESENGLHALGCGCNECRRHGKSRGLDWVIVGGESGPGARPMHPDWARSVRDQCQAAEVPFFFKQWGEYAPQAPMYGNEKDELHSLSLICIEPNGLLTPENEDGYYEYQPPVGSWLVERVGKKSAGRMLDCREWNEYPDAARSSQ